MDWRIVASERDDGLILLGRVVVASTCTVMGSAPTCVAISSYLSCGALVMPHGLPLLS